MQDPYSYFKLLCAIILYLRSRISGPNNIRQQEQTEHELSITYLYTEHRNKNTKHPYETR
jgi:hypothetical protein